MPGYSPSARAWPSAWRNTDPHTPCYRRDAQCQGRLALPAAPASAHGPARRYFSLTTRTASSKEVVPAATFAIASWKMGTIPARMAAS